MFVDGAPSFGRSEETGKGRKVISKLERKKRKTYPRIVSKMLMSKSAPHPRSRKTPIGGMKMAKMILMMSDPVKGILADYFRRVCEEVLSAGGSGRASLLSA